MMSVNDGNENLPHKGDDGVGVWISVKNKKGKQNEAENRTYFVCDTNIFLSRNNSILNTLTKNKNNIIVIPSVVTYELDCISKKKTNVEKQDCQMHATSVGTYELDSLSKKKINLKKQNCQMHAKDALNFIYIKLKNKHPQFEAQDNIMDKDKPSVIIRCQDDNVLNCAVQYYNEKKNNDVILVTNDYGLLLKTRSTIIIKYQTFLKNIPSSSPPIGMPTTFQ